MRGFGRGGPMGRCLGRYLGFCRGNRRKMGFNMGKEDLLRNLEQQLAELDKEKEAIVAQIKNLT